MALRSVRNGILKLVGLKKLRQSVLFQSLIYQKIGPYRGRFPTSQLATESLPIARRSTYDNDELVSIGIESFSTIHSFDWPILFYLQKLIHEDRLKVVTDFGGHVGVKFYAFRDTLQLPATVVWQVVDVPAIVREGKRRTAPDNTSLQFFEQVEDTVACDALICSGALQYADIPIVDLIGRMADRPGHIFLNKMPISTKGESFSTLENFGKASLPYRVFTMEELDEARVSLGYSLVSSWGISEREFGVISSTGVEWIKMIGQAWVRDIVPGEL